MLDGILLAMPIIVVISLAELIPHACYVDVAGAGHMVAGDQNDGFNAVIFELLAYLCDSP